MNDFLSRTHSLSIYFDNFHYLSHIFPLPLTLSHDLLSSYFWPNLTATLVELPKLAFYQLPHRKKSFPTRFEHFSINVLQRILPALLAGYHQERNHAPNPCPAFGLSLPLWEKSYALTEFNWQNNILPVLFFVAESSSGEIAASVSRFWCLRKLSWRRLISEIRGFSVVLFLWVKMDRKQSVRIIMAAAGAIGWWPQGQFPDLKSQREDLLVWLPADSFNFIIIVYSCCMEEHDKDDGRIQLMTVLTLYRESVSYDTQTHNSTEVDHQGPSRTTADNVLDGEE